MSLSENQHNNIITFIIPSIGRDSLTRSIKSLFNQTNNRWEAIIIFDGVEPTYKSDNEKIRVFKLDKKTGESLNSAGNVRNYGMQFVNTKWIGFLDDDDTISPNYVKTFLSEKKEAKIKNQNFDVIIFRMYNGTVLPLIHHTNFEIHHVGISFALKTKLFKKGYKFIPSRQEDYYLLDKLRENKFKIMLSPYIMYYVKSSNLPQKITSQIGERGYIE